VEFLYRSDALPGWLDAWHNGLRFCVLRGMPATTNRTRRSVSPLKKAVVLAVILAACGTAAAPTGEQPESADLPVTTAAEFESYLAGLDRPAVVNVWASWCIPCRVEAPLLNAAFEQYGEEIAFIGIDVTDNQTDAKAFLEEFGLPFVHFFDRQRTVVNHYGGIGTPVTFFFGPGGELVSTHNGIMDDRTLALNINELMRLSG